jgi:hypothetical protein
VCSCFLLTLFEIRLAHQIWQAFLDSGRQAADRI